MMMRRDTKEVAKGLRKRGLLPLCQAEAEARRLTVAELLDSRTWTATRGRDAVFARLRREHDMSLPEIGRLFGRHHTTVMHALRRVRDAEDMARLRGEL